MPLDDAPQIKKLPDNNQNSGARKACAITPRRSGFAFGVRVRERRTGLGGGIFSGGGFVFAVGAQAHPGRIVAHEDEDQR